MAIDRFVFWHNERPTKDILLKTLEDYLGGAATQVFADGNRIIAKLVGTPRYPFRRHGGFEKYIPAVEQAAERWFEVVVDEDHIDVITRQTDEFTHVVAEGFARLCRRCWHGRMEAE